jgi:hypothetical protein
LGRIAASEAREANGEGSPASWSGDLSFPRPSHPHIIIPSSNKIYINSY